MKLRFQSLFSLLFTKNRFEKGSKNDGKWTWLPANVKQPPRRHRLLFPGAQSNDIPRPFVPRWGPMTSSCQSDVSRSDGSLPSLPSVLLLLSPIPTWRLRVNSEALHRWSASVLRITRACFNQVSKDTQTGTWRSWRSLYSRIPRNRMHGVSGRAKGKHQGQSGGRRGEHGPEPLVGFSRDKMDKAG